jgi:hypothetical protein
MWRCSSIRFQQTSGRMGLEGLTNVPALTVNCYCHTLGVTINGFWIGWFDLLHTQLVTTSNYSAIADFQALQSTVTSTSVLSLLQSPLSVSWQRILARWRFFSFALVNAPHLNSNRHLLNSGLTAHLEFCNSTRKKITRCFKLSCL